MKIVRSDAPYVVLIAWAFAFVLTLLAVPIQAAPAKSWSITTLGSLGPRGGIALTINNRGDVGGYSAAVPPGAPDWFHHAVIWRDGAMIDLGAQLGSPPGWTFSQVSVINDRGTAVLSGYPGIMIWRDGVLTPLGIRGSANDLNNKDVLVGSFSHGMGAHAFMYSDGVFRDLGTLGGQYASAIAINEKGVIVGTSYITGNNTYRGFIYDSGVMTPIGTFGGAASRANDINRHGVIVGEAQDAAGVWQPFIIDKSGIRVLPNVPAGSTLYGINDRGQIIGTYENPNRQGTTSFVWEDGVTTPLEPLPEVQAAGWRALFVIDINDRGWITGWGWRVGGSFDGEGFVLIPK